MRKGKRGVREAPNAEKLEFSAKRLRFKNHAVRSRANFAIQLILSKHCCRKSGKGKYSIQFISKHSDKIVHTSSII
jgi:hypothetical protein